MGIKFEGEPPFDVGVVQTVSAQVPKTLSLPRLRHVGRVSGDQKQRSLSTRPPGLILNFPRPGDRHP